MTKDSLGDRMKEYESVPRNFLVRRTPVIIRIDGKAFHTFTKGFLKPFDDILVKAMQSTMKSLCENIQGCVLGYTQSDEITLVLTDYATIDTDAWFDYNVQKLTSISASMATAYFNRAYSEIAKKWFNDADNRTKAEGKYADRVWKAMNTNALFDARAFNIPKEEVANCLIWRQQDATRNSILSVAQSCYSHKEMQGVSCNQLQDKMLTEKGINWNNYPTTLKRGSCCIKQEVQVEDAVRHKWVIDNEIPIFTQERNYIENLI